MPSAQEIAARLMPALAAATDILTPYRLPKSRDPWDAGGCFVLADALERCLPEAQAIGMTYRATSGAFHVHAVVSYQGHFIDGRGAHTPDELAKAWPDLEPARGKLRYQHERGAGGGPTFDRAIHKDAVQKRVPIIRAALL